MTEPTMRIRAAVAADLEFLVSGNCALAVETEDRELERVRVRDGVRRVLHDPSLGFYLVAERDDRPAGQLMVTFEWSDWRNGVFWWIQSVYVPAEHRRQGVFRALYEEVVRRAEEQGDVCGLRLYVEEENGRALSAYRALGMKDSGYRVQEVDFVLGK